LAQSPSWPQESSDKVSTDIANFEIFKSVNLSVSSVEKSSGSVDNRLCQDLNLSESDEEEEDDYDSDTASDLSGMLSLI